MVRDVTHKASPWAVEAQSPGGAATSREHPQNDPARGPRSRGLGLLPSLCVGRETPGNRLAGGSGKGRGWGGAPAGGLLRCLPPVTCEKLRLNGLGKLPKVTHTVNRRAELCVLPLSDLRKLFVPWWLVVSGCVLDF